MNKSLLSVIVGCLMLVLASCSTSYQAANCPTFKQNTNKSATAQAKAKKKFSKKMQKHKAYLSEKYAMNRLEKEQAEKASQPVQMAEVVRKSQGVQPLESIDASAVASNNNELIVPNRAFNPLENFTAVAKEETKTSFIDILPKEVVSKFTPKQKERIENKISKVKERMVKKHQKAIKKGKKPAGTGKKSQLIALILCVFAGAIGIHRFYLGYIGIGVAQILTMGGCGIWALIDLVRIITGDLQPKDGRYDETL